MPKKRANPKTDATLVDAKRVPPKVPKTTDNEAHALEWPLPSDEDLKELYGTETIEAARGLLVSSMHALGSKVSLYRQLMAAIGAEEKPKSSIEAMLLIQMVTTHATFVRLAGLAHSADGIDVLAKLSKMMNASAGSFTKQSEALRRLRNGSSQTVRIEHVTVNDGGKAIVGSVPSSGGRDKNER